MSIDSGVTWREVAESTIVEGRPAVSVDWKKAVERALSVLVQICQCDIAIIRTEDVNSQRLILEGYRRGPKCRFDSDVEVPLEKPISFWNGKPFEACFVREFRKGAFSVLTEEERSLFSDRERRFLRSVRWRASFPIAVSDDFNVLIVLTSAADSRPEWLTPDKLALAWLATQVSLSSDLSQRNPPEISDGFINAVAHLSALSCFSKQENQLAVLLRLLCSGRALGWQRAWIFRLRTATYECVTCAGGVTLDEWGRGAHFASQNLSNLVDEIAHDVIDQPLNEDGLYRRFVGDSTLEIASRCFDMQELQKDTERIFDVPTAMDFDTSGQWKNTLAMFTEPFEEEFEDDNGQYFFCRVNSTDCKYLVILSSGVSQTTRNPIPQIETGILLGIASRILSTTDNEKMGDASEGAGKFSELLPKVLSWLKVSPVQHKEIERAKVRRVRLRFESSVQYHDTLRKELLDERKRRKGEM